MIGSRVGAVDDELVGSSVGSSSDDEGSAGLAVTRDSTSLIYVPANSTEWSTFLAAFGVSVDVPDSLWLCQEASGNLADSIGSLTLTANATPLYQQTASGWTRKAVAMNAVANQGFTAAAGIGPNPTTTDQTWLWIGGVTSTPAATAQFLVISDAAGQVVRISITTAPISRVTVIATNNDGSSNPVSSTLRPWALKYDRTNSAAIGYNNQEKIVGTYGAGVADGRKGICRASAVNAQFVYGCMWSGAKARISDANMKALMIAMGYSIPWS